MQRFHVRCKVQTLEHAHTCLRVSVCVLWRHPARHITLALVFANIGPSLYRDNSDLTYRARHTVKNFSFINTKNSAVSVNAIPMNGTWLNCNLTTLDGRVPVALMSQSRWFHRFGAHWRDEQGAVTHSRQETCVDDRKTKTLSWTVFLWLCVLVSLRLFLATWTGSCCHVAFLVVQLSKCSSQVLQDSHYKRFNKTKVDAGQASSSVMMYLNANKSMLREKKSFARICINASMQRWNDTIGLAVIFTSFWQAGLTSSLASSLGINYSSTRWKMDAIHKVYERQTEASAHTLGLQFF